MVLGEVNFLETFHRYISDLLTKFSFLKQNNFNIINYLLALIMHYYYKANNQKTKLL